MAIKAVDLIPAIPCENGKLAWIVARIDQISATLKSGVVVEEVWIEVSSDTASEITEQIGLYDTKFDGQVFEAELSLSRGTLPISICISQEADDTSFKLSLELNDLRQSISTTGVLGFCYPTPVDRTIVETRWVLQHIDGIEAHTAASITAVI